MLINPEIHFVSVVSKEMQAGILVMVSELSSPTHAHARMHTHTHTHTHTQFAACSRKVNISWHPVQKVSELMEKWGNC